MDNPLDGKLTARYHDTDAHIWRWHGWLCEPLMILHHATDKKIDAAMAWLDTLEDTQPVGPGDFSSEEEYQAWLKASDVPRTALGNQIGVDKEKLQEIEDLLSGKSMLDDEEMLFWLKKDMRKMLVAHAALRTELAMQEKRYASLYKATAHDTLECYRCQRQYVLDQSQASKCPDCDCPYFTRAKTTDTEGL